MRAFCFRFEKRGRTKEEAKEVSSGRSRRDRIEVKKRNEEEFETHVGLSDDVLPSIRKNTRRERRSSSEQGSSFGPGESVRCEFARGKKETSGDCSRDRERLDRKGRRTRIDLSERGRVGHGEDCEARSKEQGQQGERRSKERKRRRVENENSLIGLSTLLAISLINSSSKARE